MNRNWLAAVLLAVAVLLAGCGGPDGGPGADTETEVIDGEETETEVIDGEETETEVIDGEETETEVIDGEETETPGAAAGAVPHAPDVGHLP